MVRIKTQASKKPKKGSVESPSSKGPSDPSPMRPPSSTATPAIVKLPEPKEDTIPSSRSSSDALPLPVAREANQPTITAFFSKSPQKSTETVQVKAKQQEKEQGTSVEKLSTLVPPKSIPRESAKQAHATTQPKFEQKKVKWTKEDKNKGHATTQDEQPTQRPKKLMASSFKAAEIVQKKQEESQARKRKRKSELEDLDAPLPTPTRTRQMKTKTEPPTPAKSSISPIQRKDKDTEQPESRPLRRKT